MNLNNTKILISRTDNIGDVILTLPMAGLIKEKFPHAKIYFIAKSYTKDVVATCSHVDEFINYSKLEVHSESEQVEYIKSLGLDLVIHVYPNQRLAKVCAKAKVRYRLGTINRWWHLFYCNILPRVARKRSKLHEAELNFALIKRFLGNDHELSEIHKLYGFKKPALLDSVKSFVSADKFNIILHPLSFGSAREWGQANFKLFIEKLLESGRYNVIITGTQKEADQFKDNLLTPFQGRIQDTTGKFTLEELVSLISHADGIVAASTGPLHIGAMAGINALGLFIAKPPMHPGRWKALGERAEFMIHATNDFSLDSILRIKPERVMKVVESWNKVNS